MNDIRRTILWVVFGFSLVLLWDQWQIHNGQKATFFPQPVTAKASGTAPAPAASGVPTASAPLPAAAGAAQVPGTPTAPATTAPRDRIEVATDVLKLTFDTEGGSLVRSEFSHHADMADHSKPLVLLDESRDRVYVAQTGLIGSANGAALATHKTPMTFSGERALKEGQNELRVRFESAETGGVKLVKTYILQRGSYAIKVQHEVINTGAAAASPQLYVQLVRDGNKPACE